MREKPLKFTSWEVVKRPLVACISFAILIGIITSSFYYKEVNRERENFKDKAERNVHMLREIVTTHFESIVSDLLIISESKVLKEFIDLNNETNRSALAKEFLLYSKQKGLYDQIRFINEKGMEVVRVNFNDGEPYIVPEDELQDKGKRYYFRDTFGLDHGEAFVSPFDLNIEHGKIEQPLKPMIRLGVPVLDSHGEKRGIVLLNYLGADVLEHFEWVAITAAEEVMLLNSDGFWLKGPRREEEWGFMYEDKTNLTFSNAFPGAWQQITENDSGKFNNIDGLFIFTTFTTIYPLSENMKSSTGSRRAFEPSKAYVKSKEFNWKIVSRVTPATLYENPKRLLDKLFLWDGVFFVIFIVGSWLLAYASAKRKRAEEQAHKFSHAIEQSPCTIIITDSNGNIEYVNPKFTQLTGYTFEEAIGKNPRILKSGKTSPEEYECLWKIITSGGEWRGEFCNKKKNGKIYWEFAYISSIKNSEGVITHFIAVKEDISERKKAEVALRKSRDELEIKVEERTQEIAKANEKLKATNQQLQASEQQLKASNQQLRAGEQQLKASNQQLRASEQQLRASNQQLRANEQQLRTEIAERKKLEEVDKKHLYELEVFYKANIGREERIVELKKRIKEMEDG